MRWDEYFRKRSNIAFDYFKHCHDLLLNVGNLVVSSTKPNVFLPIFRRPLNHSKKGRLKIENRPAVF